MDEIMVFVSAAGYALLMFVVLLIHLVTSAQTDTICNESLGSAYTTTLWVNGCKVKIPFCKSMFEPSCDCAAINIKNHTMTKLPQKISVLKHLQKLSIKNGQLESLPSKLEDLQHLITFHVTFNRIKRFDHIDVSKWEQIHSIWLDIIKFKMRLNHYGSMIHYLNQPLVVMSVLKFRKILKIYIYQTYSIFMLVTTVQILRPFLEKNNYLEQYSYTLTGTGYQSSQIPLQA